MEFAKYISGVTAVAMLIIALLTDLNPTAANTTEQIPVIGSIIGVVTFRTFEDKKSNFKADIQVPQVTLENSGETQIPVNKSIEEYTNEFITDYEKELAVNNGEGHYRADSRYKVVTDTGKCLSIRADTTLTMTSDTQLVKIFIVDKTTRNVITPIELLKNKPATLEAVSDQVKQQTEAQIATGGNIIYFYHPEMPEGDFKGLTGDESYHFDQNGELVTVFSEYDMAPGYTGTVEFTIPVSVTGAF